MLNAQYYIYLRICLCWFLIVFKMCFMHCVMLTIKCTNVIYVCINLSFCTFINPKQLVRLSIEDCNSYMIMQVSSLRRDIL